MSSPGSFARPRSSFSPALPRTSSPGSRMVTTSVKPGAVWVIVVVALSSDGDDPLLLAAAAIAPVASAAGLPIPMMIRRGSLLVFIASPSVGSGGFRCCSLTVGEAWLGAGYGEERCSQAFGTRPLVVAAVAAATAAAATGTATATATAAAAVVAAVGRAAAGSTVGSAAARGAAPAARGTAAARSIV